MSALDDISSELQARSPKPEDDEYKFTLKQELSLIITRILYIFFVATLIYYIPAYLLTRASGENLDYMFDKILVFSFATGALMGLLLFGRGAAASGLILASATRTAWTGKKQEEGSFEFYRDFAFGVKRDTIMFYGSIFVFALTYAIK